MREQDALTRPGDVNIEKLQIISTRGTVVDLDDYFVEFNLYEDMFSAGLSGSILISDSRNLINSLPIIGEELLLVKFTTPTFPVSIEKTFRIVRLSDKQIVSGQSAHSYILHFISQELSLDMNSVIYKKFEGLIHDVVGEIFTDYIALNRSLEFNESQKRYEESATGTDLKILTETKNKVKFVSPGWSALKCINWLASKSIATVDKSCNFLFWESNKCFYFANLETIFKNNSENKRYAGVYTFAPNNLRAGVDRDLVREMFLAESVETVTTVDHVKNYTSGYLSNRLIELDFLNKVYEAVDYDHVDKYHDYYHMSGQGPSQAIPFFVSDSMRNPFSNIKYYPKHKGLFTDFEENVNEVYRDIHGNRLSHMLELDNFKLNIIVPGRTDVEAGQMIYLLYPNIQPKDNTDKLKDNLDPLYSGAYLITAIRHQINPLKHKMVLEVTKDSLTGNLEL